MVVLVARILLSLLPFLSAEAGGIAFFSGPQFTHKANDG